MTRRTNTGSLGAPVTRTSRASIDVTEMVCAVDRQPPRRREPCSALRTNQKVRSNAANISSVKSNATNGVRRSKYRVRNASHFVRRSQYLVLHSKYDASGLRL